MANLESADKQNIWITGASSGIGKAIVQQLAAQGHQIYISGRNLEVLDKLAAQDGNITPIPCDVGNDEAMQILLQNHDIEYLDTVILCAGTCEYIDLPLLDIQKTRRVLDSNFFGVVNSCIAALPLLKKTNAITGKKPYILGIGSMSSYLGFPRAEAYGSSKAAMSYFLNSLRSDLNDVIDITMVYPGFIKTPMTDQTDYSIFTIINHLGFIKILMIDQNDFSMPFLMSADKVVSIILKKAERRPLTIAFPLRLHMLLQFMKLFPRLWYSRVSGSLRRTSGAKA